MATRNSRSTGGMISRPKRPYTWGMVLLDELIALVNAFAADDVPYALVGGLAVAVWGAPRATKDIDLLVLPEDAARATRTAARCGFTLVAEPMRFSDGMELQRVSKIRDQLLLTLDLLLVNENLRTAWHTREKRAIEGGELWVLSREGLIAMKVSAGRPQDQADVIRLQELDR